MNRVLGLWNTSVGKKAVMAVTGVFLFGWIFAHMLGNLKLYLGPEHMNEYAKWLRVMGSPAMPNSTMMTPPHRIVRAAYVAATYSRSR